MSASAKRLWWIQRPDGKPIGLLDQLPVLARRARLAGSPEMARAHQLATRLALATLPREEARKLALADALLWPLVAWRQMDAVGPSLLKAAARDRGRGVFAQRLVSWWHCVRLGVTPVEYFRFALHRPPVRRQAGDYLFSLQSQPLYDALLAAADPAEVLQIRDKVRFCDFAREQGIPVAQILAVVSGGVIDYREPPGGAGWAGDLIMKPVRGTNGQGFYRWIRDATGQYVGAIGEVLTLERVLETVTGLSKSAPIMIQRRLVNDAWTGGVAPGALATVRLVTAKPAGEPASVIAAAIKLPLAKSLVDNYMHGNILAQIDVSRGEIGAGQQYHRRLDWIESHPETGARFAGASAPQWAEMVALARQVHDRFPSLALLAFDVAPTPDGPVIVEVNTRGDLAMVQYPGGLPLGLSVFPTTIISRLAR